MFDYFYHKAIAGTNILIDFTKTIDVAGVLPIAAPLVRVEFVHDELIQTVCAKIMIIRESALVYHSSTK